MGEGLMSEENREDWLQQRSRGIGGSDAAVLFGVSPWKSAFALYQEKIGAIPRDDRDTPALYWGRKLEPAVREAYSELVGRTITPGVVMATHPEAPWMLANTDGGIADVTEHDGPGVYEGKTTTAFSEAEWAIGVPLYYQVQVQHYMAVLDLKWASVAVLIMGSRDPFAWVDVPRDDDFISALMDVEERFWNDHVVKRVPPPVDGSKSTTAALKKLHPKDNGTIIALPDGFGSLAMRREQLLSEREKTQEELDEIDNVLRAELGDASYGLLDDGTGFSLKWQSRAEFISKATEFRVLRRCSAKSIEKLLKERKKQEAQADR